MKKTISIVILVIIAGAIFSNLGQKATESIITPELTKKSVDNTTRNFQQSEFVKGCTEDGSLTESWCICAFNALDRLHNGYWYQDQTTVDRILKEGYTQEETDAVSQNCPIEQSQQQNQVQVD